MFVVLPYRSDTVARAFPFATVALIAGNVAVATLLGFPGSATLVEGAAAPWIDSWVLRFGHFNPVTWISCAFAHGGWMHLVGNMVFLWSFGFLVEGMLGWQRFLAVYAALAVAVSAVVQILMLGAEEGGAIGASGAIMGLLAIAALWAPRNTLSLFVWIGPLVRTGAEMEVFRFCAIWLGLDLFFLLLQGFSMSGSLAHLLGAGAGVAAAVLMLKRKWIDTEGWDYFSLRVRDPRVARGVPLPLPPPPAPAPPPHRDPRVAALVALRDALDAGDAGRAYAAYESGARASSPAWLPEREREELLDLLGSRGQTERLISLLEVKLAARPPDEAAVRLTLAERLLDAGRPGRAREVMAGIDATESARSAAIRRRIDASRKPGGLELE